MLVLASSSPRRESLLKKIYKDEFLIVPSKFDERALDVKKDETLPLILSFYKGKEVSSNYPSYFVLSADTAVYYQGEMLNKPNDFNEARRFLNKLNDNYHKVVTGYSIFLNSELLLQRKVDSILQIHIDKNKIEEYIATASPFDKAGGYGIQDTSYISSKIVSGHMSNVMGLPIEELELDLISLNILAR